MGLILQLQRRAIESLCADRNAGELRYVQSNTSFSLLDQQNPSDPRRPIRAFGVSRGVGTCSDIHGMDVLVFGDGTPDDGIPMIPLSDIQKCCYAVLLRKPTPEELGGYSSSVDPRVLQCVDRLIVRAVRFDSTLFERNHQTARYARI